MRCLTLARALREVGEQCHFICREHPGNLIEHIRQRGFSVSVLPKAIEGINANELCIKAQSHYKSWLGVAWDVDAAQTKAGIGPNILDWLIVDHYSIDSCWEKELRPMCRNLMVIDDLADRPHDCDLLLDQNLGRSPTAYRPLIPETSAVLVGPQYALLRPEFAELRPMSLFRRSIPQLKHVLIAMGGVDQSDVTGQVLEILADCPLPTDLTITVVMGHNAPWLNRVRSIAKDMPRQTNVAVGIDNMAQLIVDSDLAIGAAGGSSLERCCLGLPTLTLILADNQISGATALEQAGCVKLLKDVNDIRGSLEILLHSNTASSVLKKLSNKSYLVTDGLGTSRIKDALNEFAI